MNWNTFFTRTGTAIVFALVMFGGLFGPFPCFFALMLLVQTLCIFEYFKLHARAQDIPANNFLPAAVSITAALALSACNFSGTLQNVSIALAVVMPVVFAAFSLSGKGKASLEYVAGLGALAYIALPLCLLSLLRNMDWLAPVNLIALIWINDTMAYIVGSFIGKTPFSSISPKKTWEGTGGGALLTVVAAVIFAQYFHFLPTVHMVALSLCAAVAGTLGDLFESKLKREAGVKDSGSFMPGHGGALDRFDSLLFAAPLAFAWFWAFRALSGEAPF